MRKNKKFIALLAGFMALILALGLIAGVLPSLFVNAASLSELEKQLEALKEQKKEADSQIADLEAQLSDNLSSMQAVVNQKNTIDQQIFSLYQQTQNLNDQIAAYGLLIAQKQEELEEAQARLAELNEKNKERIRAMEEDGDLSYWSVLFQANDFADLLDRLNMVEEIAAADQRRLKEMSQVAQEVADAKAALEEEQKALEVSKAELEKAQVQLEEKRAEADRLLNELVATGEEYQKLLDEAEAAAGALKDKISDAQDAYDAAEYQQWLSTSKPAQSGTSGSSGNSSHIVQGLTWIVPTSYVYMSSPFGWRVHPVYGDWRFHYGVDLAARSGTPIVATRSGVVTRAYYDYSGGYTVELDHQDGFGSKYLHMTHYIVSDGQYVNAGQVIGYVGSTGTSTGAHLHFSITYNGEHQNPMDYIGG